jgi:sialic acid synthase SpsE
MSLDPIQLARYVEALRQASASIGSPRIDIYECERAKFNDARRGLYWGDDYTAGTNIRLDMLKPLRPMNNTNPQNYQTFIGKTLFRDVHKGSDVTAADLDPLSSP